ncbi:MAG: hypothetical protein V1862_09150 [Methanobacteriota archaeon]
MVSATQELTGNSIIIDEIKRIRSENQSEPDRLHQKISHFSYWRAPFLSHPRYFWTVAERGMGSWNIGGRNRQALVFRIIWFKSGMNNERGAIASSPDSSYYHYRGESIRGERNDLL